MSFIEEILLAFGGYAFHLLKQWKESYTRKEVFDKTPFLISVGSNVLAIFLLIYIGEQLPPDLLTMSPFTCILIGAFGSSMLSGFINFKKPKNVEGNTE